MTHLRTPDTSALYDADRERLGYVANYSRVFALAPEVYAAWVGLATAARDGLDPRRYELATLAAARRLGSDYCTLAHATVLQDRFFDAFSLLAITVDRHSSGLDPAEVAVMDFAEKVAGDPASVTPADTGRLRDHGLSDVDIFHVIATVAARRFFTAVIAATGAEPDAYDTLDPLLRKALLDVTPPP